MGKPLFLPEPPFLGPRVEKIHSKFSKSRLRSSLGLVLRRGLQGPGGTARPHLPPHLPIPAPSLSLNSAGRVARPGLFSAFNQLSCCFPPGGGGEARGRVGPGLPSEIPSCIPAEAREGGHWSVVTLPSLRVLCGGRTPSGEGLAWQWRWTQRQGHCPQTQLDSFPRADKDPAE